MLSLLKKNKNESRITGSTSASQERDGFTLIEVLIYSALVSVFLGSSIAFITSVLSAADIILARNEVATNMELVTGKLEWLVEQGSRVVNPPAGSSSTQLELEEADIGLNPTIFTLNGSAISLSLGGTASASITNNRVNVNEFSVEHYSTDQSSSTLRISLEIGSMEIPNIKSTSILFYTLPE